MTLKVHSNHGERCAHARGNQLITCKITPDAPCGIRNFGDGRLFC